MESYFYNAAGMSLVSNCSSGLNQLTNTTRYLYEREWYNVARGFVDAALQTFEDETSLAFASAIDLSGLIDLDMNNPYAALCPLIRHLRSEKGS